MKWNDEYENNANYTFENWIFEYCVESFGLLKLVSDVYKQYNYIILYVCTEK